ncbi:hypothetical protein BC940DRAFT_302699 [Gongronella butleri]|nr:hypothetical protein BC940DRAFT_302699 [Gongronella butleri]
MAFIQQRQRRQATTTPLLSSDTEDIASVSSFMDTSFGPSDSDTDWHLISQQLHPSPSTRTTSTSRRDSMDQSLSSFRPSDLDSYDEMFATLPAHDGTGAFVDAAAPASSDDDQLLLHDDLPADPALGVSQTSQTPALSPQQQQIAPFHRTKRRPSFRDFEPSSSSMPNILLPHGGIRAPSFAQSTDDTPYFQPTAQAHHWTTSQSEDSKDDADTRSKPRRDLDRIPSHHPSFFPMTSLALLSALWDNLRRLTNHLLENDANAADTFTALVAEASLEGCLPFGNHLHMDLAVQPT